MRPFCVVESRFKGGDGWTESENLMAARFYCRKAVEFGYNPVASHLFYPQFLADNDPRERAIGIELGLQLATVLRPEVVWFCVRVNARGRREKMSEGMQGAKAFWDQRQVPSELWVCRPSRSGEPELILSSWEEQEDDGYGLRLL